MNTETTNHKILIAGVGNVLQGDDGFGIELANSLMERTDLPQSVKIIETGIGGMSLIQELMYGYDALVILDAYKNNQAPGHLYMLEPVFPDMSDLTIHELRDYFSDTHYATPIRALNFLAHIDRLPDTIRIIGCEPEELDDLKIGLSPPVAAAIEEAMQMILTWLNDYLSETPCDHHEAALVTTLL